MNSDQSQLRPIDTAYNGYLFRSRLEARWAIFFDALRIPYRYELEGFTRNGINYLPDFWFPNGLKLLGEEGMRSDVWGEVKPSANLSDEERAKIVQLVENTDYTLLLFAGDPWPNAVLRFISYDSNARQWRMPFVSWIDMGQDGINLVQPQMIEQLSDPNFARRLLTTPRLMAAYAAARQARFDNADPATCLKQCESCGRPFLPRKSNSRFCHECYHQQRAAREWAQPTSRAIPPAIVSPPDESELSAQDLKARENADMTKAFLIFFAIILMLYLGIKVASSGTSNPAFVETPVPPCSCEVNAYDKCRSFETHAEAQRCYDYCLPIAGDVHRMDPNGDGQVCLGK